MSPRLLPLLAVCAVACGGGADTGATGDTGQPTDTGDTGDTEVPTALAITLNRAGAPLAGHAVTFHDAEGAILGKTTTDDGGVATWDPFPTDGAATAVFGEAGARRAYTLTGLQPASAPLFELAPEHARLGDLRVSVGDEPDGDPVSYEVFTPCAPTGTELTGPSDAENVPVDTTCLDAEGTLDLFAWAYDADGHRVAYTHREDIVAPDEGLRVLALRDWKYDQKSVEVRTTDAPQASAEASVAVALVRDGRTVLRRQAGAVPLSAGASHTFTVADVPASGFDLWVVETALAYQASDTASRATTYEALAELHDVLEIDLSSRQAPRLHDLEVDASEPDRPSVQWAVDGSVGGDGAYVALSWSTSEGEATWYVVRPGGADPAMRFPVAPAELVMPTRAADLAMAEVQVADPIDAGGYYDAQQGIPTNGLFLPPAREGRSTYTVVRSDEP